MVRSSLAYPSLMTRIVLSPGVSRRIVRGVAPRPMPSTITRARGGSDVTTSALSAEAGKTGSWSDVTGSLEACVSTTGAGAATAWALAGGAVVAEFAGAAGADVGTTAAGGSDRLFHTCTATNSRLA